MADNAESHDEIVSYLNRCPEKSASVLDISKNTTIQKQQVQRTLKELKRRGVVSVRRETPHKWYLLSHQLGFGHQVGFRLLSNGVKLQAIHVKLA